MNLINIVACIGLLDVVTFGVLNIVIGDVAVRRLYCLAQDTWQTVGKPVGLIWVPPKTTVQDTLTIYERRIGISEIYNRVCAAPGHEKAVHIVQGYYRFHRVAISMIGIGIFCFILALILSVLNK